jgi:HSP20 family protein
MDDAFELFFGAGKGAAKPIGMQPDLGWRPATDVYETAEEFIIQMDLAGMRPEDIEVWVEADYLLVKGERNNIAPPGKKHFHKMEIQVGPFERAIRVPENADLSSVSASYRSGFLFIHLRRGKHVPQSRRSIKIDGQD